MTASNNPFVYVGANDLPAETLVDYYIEDFNYSRFVQSKRNVLLVGERGCGKSMTLIFNSWPLQQLKDKRNHQPSSLDSIGVYIPCNTPLVYKAECQLLSDFRAQALSEHLFVLSIVYAIAQTLDQIPGLSTDVQEPNIRSRLEFILDTELPPGQPLFRAIMDFSQRENLRTQRAINDDTTTNMTYDATYSFASLVVPLLNVTRTIPSLSATHYLLLIDDAHDLNVHQLRALASWIAYRDHSLFSFKVAVANLAEGLHTASGGSILEGHDYIRLDMAQPYQNEASDFGRLAERLVDRRLKRFDIASDPKAFFPTSPQLDADLNEAERVVREEAVQRYGTDRRRVSDYVYKYARAHYFRQRSPRANRPEYSGFTTLVFLSTGVIRNLLLPCYYMYDKMLSLNSDDSPLSNAVTTIPPSVQSEVILERSRSLWDWLRNGIDQNIVGCSRQDAEHCYNLFDQLAVMFRERLLRHKSEPRANSFTVSGQTAPLMENLGRLFNILREAQLLYIRSGSAKEKGKRDWYYVPNRLLWPDRGLDPHGQHARVSIPAADLWAAAEQNRPIHFDAADDCDTEVSLFDDTK